jgi:hypothetical protein
VEKRLVLARESRQLRKSVSVQLSHEPASVVALNAEAEHICEGIADREDLLRAIVKCGVCEIAIALQLFIVRICTC